MDILHTLEPSNSTSVPCVLSIGSFDGVHRGHLSLIEKMRDFAGDGSVGVITFSNHPSHVLPTRHPENLILSKSLKIRHLEQAGVDIAYILEFTEELAKLDYQEFLHTVRKAFPFDILVLGEGASLGRKREGTSAKLEALGKREGFVCEFLPKVQEGSEIVSSGIIRQAIKAGDFDQAAQLLSRPLTIEASVENGKLTFQPFQCLPPDGKYLIRINNELNGSLLLKEEGAQLLPATTHEKVSLTFI